MENMEDMGKVLTPVERAAAVYGREACARTFREDLEAHLLRGLVFSTPTAFVMARRVAREWPREWIVDPWVDGAREVGMEALVEPGAGMVPGMVPGAGYLKWDGGEGGTDLTCAPKNCIHIYLAAGDVGEIFGFPHEPCDWISYERNNILRFHSYESLKKRYVSRT